ncbi:MAG: hypothetical protein H6642_10645 [Caldilineaceae bacterium]|nr:hypothetical protein [Caldilineaceae bacterium]
MEELMRRPTMVGESSGHGGRALNPAVASLSDPEPKTQAVVMVTENGVIAK